MSALTWHRGDRPVPCPVCGGSFHEVVPVATLGVTITDTCGHAVEAWRDDLGRVAIRELVRRLDAATWALVVGQSLVLRHALVRLPWWWRPVRGHIDCDVCTPASHPRECRGRDGGHWRCRLHR